MGNIKYEKADGGYVLLEDYTYHSKRYNRDVELKKGMWSDGATGAPDIGSGGLLDKVINWFRIKLHGFVDKARKTAGWFVHDELCNTGKWADGTPIDNWSASTVIGDILWGDGYKIFSVLWWWATYLFGGGAARKNGMRRVDLI